MAELKHMPVPHNHKVFLAKAKKRKGFNAAYESLEEEYAVVREMIAARRKSNLTQEGVAKLMATTKSAVSRLESAGKHTPSLATLKKYALAVNCRLEIKLVPKRANNRSKKPAA